MQIDRSKWNSGGRYQTVRLLNDAGKMCCLGFYAKALGAQDKTIVRVPFPSHCKLSINWPEAMFSPATIIDIGDYWEWEDVFAKLNDVPSIEDSIREDWIKTGFKIVFNVDVEFVGEY